MNRVIGHKPAGRHLLLVSLLTLPAAAPHAFAAESITGDCEMTTEFEGTCDPTTLKGPFTMPGGTVREVTGKKVE